jgi:iron complex transport system ATP-binding protein
MAILGIEHLINRSILDLSGGERQLVLVARALAQESPWLLLDEPTAFLDLRHRVTALRVIRERAALGHGALVVSHDLSLASRVCDRMVLLGDGEIVAQGAPEEVLTPARVLEVFGIEVQVIASPEGAPIVIPEISTPVRRE